MLLLCSCLFGVFISYSGASVSLVTDNNMTSFQDGTDVTLICTISPYNNVMTWLVNNDPYADCFLGSCGASSNKPYTFIYNFDESNGKFKLTIESVNSTHAGLLFACDDGNERKTITFDVTTGDKDQNNTSITNTSSTTVGQSGSSNRWCRILTKDCECTVLIICSIILGVVWLYGCIQFCWKFCWKKKTPRQGCGCCIAVLLCIPIVGFVVIIVLVCKKKLCDKDEMLEKCREKQRIVDGNKFYCENCMDKTPPPVSHAYSLLDKKYLCLECLYKSLKKKECVHLWHKDRIGPLNTCNTDLQMCCEENDGISMLGFCITCKIFICEPCSEDHLFHIIITSLIRGAEAKLCCKKRSRNTEDFCIQCNTFICASCKFAHNNCVDISALTGLISTKAGLCCKLVKDKKIMDFCIHCQIYICDSCESDHTNQYFVSSILAAPMSKILCKGSTPDDSHATLKKKVFQFIICDKNGNLETNCKHKSEYQKSNVQNDTEKRKKKNRSQVHKGNLFFCNCCQSGEPNPVECYDLKYSEFKCGKCYIHNSHSNPANSYPKEVTDSVICEKNSLCQMHEDRPWSAPVVVYCLVCQKAMCKSCFKKHRKFKDENSIQHMQVRVSTV